LLIPVVIVLVLLLGGFGGLVTFYADLLWFREVGFSSVFTTVLRTRILLFVLFGTAMATLVGLNLVLAYRLRPAFRPMSLEQQNLERYRVALEPRLRSVLLGVTGILGLFAGTSAAGRWQTWLLWRNGTPFGVDDPQFGRDISYFTFTYPFQRFVLGFLFTAVVLSILAAAATHYLFGGIRLQTPGERVTAAARGHLSVLLGIFVLLKAVAYYLDRFGLMFSPRGIVTGASYTDVNAVLPAKAILLFVALICAGTFIANVVVRNFFLPAIAFGLLIVSAVVIGGIYPAVVEQFSVRPNANEKEAPYIARNIAATRSAYGIVEGQTVTRTSYPARTTATTAELRAETGTIPNARLLDPNVLTDTFTQLQQIRNVYGFADKLDIDRYTVDGKMQDYVVAVRELDSSELTGNQTNWINRHLVYTHGNGFVAAPANQVQPGGQPVFTTGNLPTKGDIRVTQPRIYYGELLDDYSVVGRSGSGDREFDRPADDDGTGDGGEQINFTYDGRGGVAIDNPTRRLAYALYFRERNLLLSGALNDNSKILYVRNPRDRVEKVAPYLQIDGDPYPAVVGGRIKWILDGYTTSDGFPYSERETLGEVTQDSLTGTGVAGQPQEQVNYIRNSVKATVDAYDGTVTLYAFDERDPVLRTWQKAFPGTVRPASEISDELRAHLRYPEDLFKVQRELLTRYHVDDPQEFFNGQDYWRIPPDPTTNNQADQPPYYILAEGPGQEEPTFQLTSALTALRRANLSAYVTVSSDPETYGKMQVFELPGNTAIQGPGQVQNTFRTTDVIRRDLTLFATGESRVVFGNLLTLPVGGGLLYIEPLYVQGEGENTYPLLRKVLVNFGDRVAYEDTLEQALESLFGPGAGQNVPDTPTSTDPGSGPRATATPPPPDGTASPSPSPTAQPPADQAAAVAEIRAALEDLRTAQQQGNFAAIGQAQQRLANAVAAFEQVSGGTPSPAASPSG